MKKFLVRMQSKTAEGSIETAIKVLTAVVLGALILLGLYAIVKDLVVPTTSNKISSMFGLTESM